MYGIRIRHMASVFMSLEDIKPTDKNFSGLTSLMSSEGLFPQIVRELHPLGSNDRIGLFSVDSQWQLIVGSSRLDFMQTPLDGEGTNLLSFGDFCAKASNTLTKAMTFFDRQGNRLAAVEEGFLSITDPKDMDALAGRLLNLPPSFKQPIPFEWDWRAATRILREFGDRSELTNTLLTMKRATSILHIGETALQIDAVRADVDVNTTIDDVTLRFDPQAVTSFLSASVEWHNSLISEFSEFALEKRKDADVHN